MAKERQPISLGELRARSERLARAIGRVNLMAQDSGGNNWPEGLNLDKIDGEAFLGTAVRVGAITDALFTKTIPTLTRKKEGVDTEIETRIADAQQNVRKIEEFAARGLYGEKSNERVEKARQILQELRGEPLIPTTETEEIKEEPTVHVMEIIPREEIEEEIPEELRIDKDQQVIEINGVIRRIRSLAIWETLLFLARRAESQDPYASSGDLREIAKKAQLREKPAQMISRLRRVIEEDVKNPKLIIALGKTRSARWTLRARIRWVHVQKEREDVGIQLKKEDGGEEGGSAGLKEKTEEDIDDLVQSAQNGNQEVFGTLYNRFFSRVRRYILARGASDTEAEDIVQEVFLKAWGNLRDYEFRGAPFSAWLFRIAKNTVISSYRYNQSRPSTTELTDIHLAVLPSSVDIEDDVVNRFLIEEVRQYLPLLSDGQRQVLELRFFARLPIKQTALILGISEGNVRVTTHNGIARLREIMKKKEIEEGVL